MKVGKNIEKVIRKLELSLDINAKTDEAVLSAILGAQEKTKQTKLAATQPNTWRMIMKTKITKFATAAVIIIGIGLGLNFFGISPNGSSIAWAQVARQLERAKAYSFRAIIKMDGKPEMESHITFSSEHGLKMETIMNGVAAYIMYVNPREEYTIMVVPERKMYTRSEHPALDDMQKQSYDPRYIFKQIMECEYVELGRKVIDGIEVKGIETTDPKFDGGKYKDVLIRLWVDIEKGWPVMIEMSGTGNSTGGQSIKMHMLADEYQWDIDVDLSQFQPDIPEDYTDGNPTIDFKNRP